MEDLAAALAYCVDTRGCLTTSSVVTAPTMVDDGALSHDHHIIKLLHSINIITEGVGC
jgi:hypothetical protein